MTTIDEIQQQKIQLQKTLSQETSTIKNELSKIDSLQNKVKEMQQELLMLTKVQKSCDKKNNQQINSALLTIRNKVLLSQSNSLAKLRQQKIKSNLDIQKIKIKHFRQKSNVEIQNAKKENLKIKQNMMKEIKQISIKNDQVIKRTKEQILQKNRLKASNVKIDKQNYKQTLMQSKIKQMKQKHDQQMKKSQLRIQKKAQLQIKYEQLLKEKQLIESRVNQKKQYSRRLESLKNNISKMNNSEISNTIAQIKKRMDKYEKQKLSHQMTQQQLQKDEEYVKYKLFKKYFQVQQKRREQKDTFTY